MRKPVCSTADTHRHQSTNLVLGVASFSPQACKQPPGDASIQALYKVRGQGGKGSLNGMPQVIGVPEDLALHDLCYPGPYMFYNVEVRRLGRPHPAIELFHALEPQPPLCSWLCGRVRRPAGTQLVKLPH